MKDYLQDDDTTQGKEFTLQDLIDLAAELFAQEEDKPLIIYITKSNYKNYETKTTLLQLQALRVH